MTIDDLIELLNQFKGDRILLFDCPDQGFHEPYSFDAKLTDSGKVLVTWLDGPEPPIPEASHE